METLAIKIVFFALALMAYLIQIVGVPGNFAGALVALVYLLTTDIFPGWGRFFLLLALAFSGEVMDALMGLFGARKFGASKRGMAAAGLGGILGALLGGMVVPIIGSVVGVFLGIFILTFMTEMRIEEKSAGEAGLIGKGAVLGRLGAMAYKYAVGLVILILLGAALF